MDEVPDIACETPGRGTRAAESDSLLTRTKQSTLCHAVRRQGSDLESRSDTPTGGHADQLREESRPGRSQLYRPSPVGLGPQWRDGSASYCPLGMVVKVSRRTPRPPQTAPVIPA